MYLSLISSGDFLASRKRHSEVCAPFDRLTYLGALKRQLNHIALPEAFEMWILEWPAFAAFDFLWPGLPYEWSLHDVPFRRHGWNLLANSPPQLFTLRFIVLNSGGKESFVPALPMWEYYGCDSSCWLVLDDHDSLYGRVVSPSTPNGHVWIDREKTTVASFHVS